MTRLGLATGPVLEPATALGLGLASPKPPRSETNEKANTAATMRIAPAMTSGVGRRPTRRAPLRPRLRMTGATGVIAGPEAGGTSSGSGGSVAGPGAVATGFAAISPPADGTSPAGSRIRRPIPWRPSSSRCPWPPQLRRLSPPLQASGGRGRSWARSVRASAPRRSTKRSPLARRPSSWRPPQPRSPRRRGPPGASASCSRPAPSSWPARSAGNDVTCIQADESLLRRRQRRRRRRCGTAVRAVRPGPDRRATVGRPGPHPTHLRRRSPGRRPSRRSRAPAGRRSRGR